MGGTCCKKIDSPTSPQLPLCEVLRRCARHMCPLEPPVQKYVYRTRKYGLSDIAGPVIKKDSWVQTDPLPPPRRKRKKNTEIRKRSRSLDFIPSFFTDPKGACSLENLSGEEDAIDFQLYFMNRLPRNSTTSLEERKDSISGRKKEFLSGLLGEENNNLPGTRTIQSAPELSLNYSMTVSYPESSSRKSSITESLKEFETSLLDMLQDVADEEEETNIEPLKAPALEMVRPKEMIRIYEEKEDNYVLTPLEEETEEDLWDVENFMKDFEKNNKKNDRCKVVVLENGSSNNEKLNNCEESGVMHIIKEEAEEKRKESMVKYEMPIIKIETVS